MKCPICGKIAKSIKGKKYVGWYYCNNPSCNMTAFEVKK